MQQICSEDPLRGHTSINFLRISGSRKGIRQTPAFKNETHSTLDAIRSAIWYAGFQSRRSVRQTGRYADSHSTSQRTV